MIVPTTNAIIINPNPLISIKKGGGILSHDHMPTKALGIAIIQGALLRETLYPIAPEIAPTKTATAIKIATVSISIKPPYFNEL
ncbi:MAG TPA: hypothetical protein VI821_02005 [Candidatus Paceibacterota bacterium]